MVMLYLHTSWKSYTIIYYKNKKCVLIGYMKIIINLICNGFLKIKKLSKTKIYFLGRAYWRLWSHGQGETNVFIKNSFFIFLKHQHHQLLNSKLKLSKLMNSRSYLIRYYPMKSSFLDLGATKWQLWS
jgi:hypothetical protein